MSNNKKMDADTIANIVKLCVGHVNATGETNYDVESIENLRTLFCVIDGLLEDIQSLVPNSKSPAFSVANIGCTSIGYLAGLKDNIDEWLEQRW